jgi:hypothetical protein
VSSEFTDARPQALLLQAITFANHMNTRGLWLCGTRYACVIDLTQEP